MRLGRFDGGAGPAVFISYRRSDSPGHAGRLRDELVRSRQARDVFMDVDSITPGSDFTQTIEAALAQTDVLLLVIGPRWETGSRGEGSRLDDPQDFVRRELAAALDTQVRVIPVLVGGAVMPAPDDLPESLRPLAYREAFELRDTRWSRDVADLLAHLVGRSQGSSQGSSPPRRWPVVAAAGAVGAVVVAAALAVPLLRSGDEGNEASGPRAADETTSTSVSTSATPPTEITSPTDPTLREFFTGITPQCDDTTDTWPGVSEYDAVQVIGCDFKGFIVDFHQWPDAAGMKTFADGAKRDFSGYVKESTRWRKIGGKPGGTFYIFEVRGGFELLWTVDDVLMSGRMFAEVESPKAIQALWEERPGVKMDQTYFS